MAFASVSRQFAGQVATRVLAAAGASASVTRQSQTLGRAVQHATMALNHSVNRVVDSGNMSLGAAVELEVERKKFMGLLQDSHVHALPTHSAVSNSSDCMEDSQQRPTLPMSGWEQEHAMHSSSRSRSPMQQLGMKPVAEHGSRSMHMSSNSVSMSHSTSHLLKFLQPKALEPEEDSANNLTLMEALQQQKAKLGMPQVDTCSSTTQ